MRRLILVLLVLVGSVWVGVQVAQNAGYILVAYGHYTVTVPLWFGVLSILTTLILLYLMLRLIDRIGGSFARFRLWLQWRKKRNAYTKTTQGFIELVEENYRRSEKQLLAGVSQSDAPLVNYLALAKVTDEMGQFDKRDRYLRLAHEVAPNASLAIGLVQARLYYTHGQLEQAQAVLLRLKTDYPHHPALLKLLERIYIHLADWSALLGLLPSLRKAKTASPSDLDALERRIYEALLTTVGNKKETLYFLQSVWKRVPKKLQKEPELVACYVKQLLLYPGTSEEAASLIASVMKKQTHPALLALYGSIKEDPKKQLTIAEEWLKRDGMSAPLSGTLARLSVRCGLWGKAKSYFETSLKLGADPTLVLDYAKLLESLGDTGSVFKVYQEGLKKAAG